MERLNVVKWSRDIAAERKQGKHQEKMPRPAAEMKKRKAMEEECPW